MTEPPIAEFDHHRSEFHRERLDRWAELRSCPVAFNPRFGGFWVVSGYSEVAAVARDGATYSSRYVPEPDDGIDYLGITGIPRAKHLPTAGIAEVEGPASALVVVDGLDLDGYHPFHATRADLLRRLGRADEAAAAYDRAIGLTANPAEQALLTARRRHLQESQGNP